MAGRVMALGTLMWRIYSAGGRNGETHLMEKLGNEISAPAFGRGAKLEPVPRPAHAEADRVRA